MAHIRFNSPRWGRFKINSNIFQRDFYDKKNDRFLMPLWASEFFGQVLITRAIDNPVWDGVEYWGISELFDELKEGDEIPEYCIRAKNVEEKNDDGTIIYSTKFDGVERIDPNILNQEIKF